MFTTFIRFIKRIRQLINKPDFRRNPIIALYKRFMWRLRWKIRKEPWVLHLSDGRTIAVPQSGSGALIYYMGCSEPELTAFLKRILKPGMIFFDVGAHIGEYVIVGATTVAPNGEVHAFEPDERNFNLLQNNVKMNNLSNVVLNFTAVYEENTTLELIQTQEPSTSHIASNSLIETGSFQTVKAITLDSYKNNKGIDRVDVLKIDVEGAELFVLRGAETLLDKPKGKAPIVIFEYSQANCQRFGYHPDDIIKFLKSKGYTIWVLKEKGTLERLSSALLPGPKHHINLVAIKNTNVR